MHVQNGCKLELPQYILYIVPYSPSQCEKQITARFIQRNPCIVYSAHTHTQRVLAHARPYRYAGAKRLQIGTTVISLLVKGMDRIITIYGVKVTYKPPK